jgi:hypothetical protein
MWTSIDHHRSLIVSGLSTSAFFALLTSARAETTQDQVPASTAVSDARAGSYQSPPPPPAYSLPWQLRAVMPANAIRLDSSIAFYDNAADQSGSTVVTTLLACYKLTPNLMPLIRAGLVENEAPGTQPGGSSLLNPIVGLLYGRRIESIRWALFAGATIPIGSGSGDAANTGTSLANAAGRDARSGMDNAMFAVDYFAAGLGGDLAYIDHRLTVQVEATLFQLLRVHGSDAGPQSTDAARTNSTFGLHAGYFIISHLSIGGEVRYQRWLTTPTRLVNGAKVDVPDANKDQFTVAVGPRAHFAVGHGLFVRPGISYTRALDNPLAGESYNVLQVDVPVVF